MTALSLVLKSLEAFQGPFVLRTHILTRHHICRETFRRKWMVPKDKGGLGFPQPVNDNAGPCRHEWRTEDVLRWEIENDRSPRAANDNDPAISASDKRKLLAFLKE